MSYLKISALNITNMAKKPFKAIKGISNHELKNKPNYRNRFDPIKQIYQYVKDSKIKNHINEKINLLLKDNTSIYKKLGTYSYCKDLIDANNVLNNRYSMLGECEKYYKTYKEINDKETTKIFINTSMWNKKFLNNFLRFADKNDTDFILEFKKIINFKNDLRLEALKNYLVKYSDKEPDMTNYMYKKYYLSRLNKTVRNSCEKIQEKFGTKVFVFDEKEQKHLDYIYDELLDWKIKSNNEAKFPPILDLTQIKELYIREEKPALGIFNIIDKKINIKTPNSLRHEMIHLNTTSIGFSSELIKSNEILMTRKYENELKNAGVPEQYIEAAHVNRIEFLAYSSEVDCSKYSDEFKSALTELGLPEWVFKLNPPKNITEEQ